MTTVPTRFAAVILCFAGVFRQRTWRWAEQLLAGALLVPGIRTVASVLRVLGLSSERHFVNYHRVLSRAMWSPRAAARVLLLRARARRGARQRMDLAQGRLSPRNDSITSRISSRARNSGQLQTGT
jgi:hypothetical protein